MTYPATNTRAYTTELVTDERAFAELTADWGRLYGRCAAATPFQSHAWLHSVAVVRRARPAAGAAGPRRPRTGRRRAADARTASGAVAGAAGRGDLRLRGRPAGRRARGGRGGRTHRRSVRVGPHRADRPARGTAGRRRRTGLRPAGAGPGAGWPTRSAWSCPPSPWTNWPPGCPRPIGRQRVRAQLRRLDALGVKSRTVLPDEVDAALRRLLELHRLQWQGRKVTGEHLRTRFRDHLVRAVGPMVRSGDAVVTEFRMDDEVVAVDVTLLSRRLAGGYLYGAHPRLRGAEGGRGGDAAGRVRRKHARAPGRGTLSLLGGDEPYKHHWRPEPVPNQRLLLARRHTAPLLSAALCDVAARRRGQGTAAPAAGAQGAEGARRWRQDLTAPAATSVAPVPSDTSVIAPVGGYLLREYQSRRMQSFPPSQYSTQSPSSSGEQSADGRGAVGGTAGTGGAVGAVGVTGSRRRGVRLVGAAEEHGPVDRGGPGVVVALPHAVRAVVGERVVHGFVLVHPREHAPHVLGVVTVAEEPPFGIGRWASREPWRNRRAPEVRTVPSPVRRTPFRVAGRTNPCR